MTETQQRFLRAIAERVPMEQVVELHLFPPIRQGGVETGVAVVAEDPRRPTPNDVPEAVAGDALESDDTVPSVAASVADRIAYPAEQAEEVSDIASDVASDVASPAGIVVAEGATDDESPYAEEDDTEANSAEEDGIPRAAAPPSRFTIHTARYRLTLKGVDRGKWEVDVVAEADAPLDALDAVVRGVQRRAGEGAEPDRLNAEAFRGALEAPLATLER